MSFSMPIELSIQMEECMESEKITRSDLIKRAIELYLGIKESNIGTNKLISEIYNNILEIKDLLKNR
jgi:metal-responsive CopG/Arc/MetJ family transcriptional regulator